MKLPAATALALLVPLVAPADWVMEDVIESPQGNFEATLKIKGDQCRMDTPKGVLGASSLIANAATGEVLHLVHARKELRRLSEGARKNGNDPLKGNTTPASGGEPPKATGKTEKIGDWDCEIYTWEDSESSVKLWVATNVPKAAEIKAMIKKVDSGPFGLSRSGPDTSALPGVTVKTETTTATGRWTTSVRSIKEQNVDPAEFEVPKGYKVQAPPSNPRTPSSPSGAPGIEKKGR